VPFQLDEDFTGSIGQLEASVTDKQSLDDRAKQAVWGYAHLDPLKHHDDLSFGTWNFCTVNKSEVAKLIQSFLMWGLDHFSLTHTIPIIISLDAVLPDSFAVEPEPTVNLPLLMIDSSALSKGLLVATGGQHHLCTLKAWLLLQVWTASMQSLSTRASMSRPGPVPTMQTWLSSNITPG
jgi:hypothetical protein